MCQIEVCLPTDCYFSELAACLSSVKISVLWSLILADQGWITQSTTLEIIKYQFCGF
jgi:hypothetical protein